MPMYDYYPQYGGIMERSSSQEMEGEEYHRGESFDNGKRRSQSDMRNNSNNISYDEYQHHP